jgi:hypothetical protein
MKIKQDIYLSFICNVFMNTGEMSDEVTVKTGDTFNETDDDRVQCVLKVHADRDPPVTICRTMKRESESEETDEEYALEYVDMCVEKRKEFVKLGYDKLTVYEIYKMSVKELKQVLSLAKQNKKGDKDKLRHRLCYFLDICVIPSDVSSGSDTEPEPKEAAAAPVPNVDKNESEQPEEAAAAPATDGNETDENMPDLIDGNDTSSGSENESGSESEEEAAAPAADGNESDDSTGMPNLVVTDESGDEDADDEDDEDYAPTPKKSKSKKTQKKQQKAKRGRRKTSK